MPVDYSKWDALELSDDSDIEVHPNVDKKSFIRAKQNQIHAQRDQRRHQIAALKYERQINDGLMNRISSLLNALRSHAADAESRNPAEVAFQAVMESAGNPEDDKPPTRPEGVHANVDQPPTYSKMMVTLLDEVNKSLNEKKPENRYIAMTEEVGEHLRKVQDLQRELLEKLAELEKLEGSKITSESYRTGFDSSHVAKSQPSIPGEKKENSGQAELLNPNFSLSKPEGSKNTTSATSVDDDDAEIEASQDGRKFANIKASEYRESHAFISSYPNLLTEKETDGILVLAFDAALEGKLDLARQYVHQALLIQYCRALGKDGVSLFFKRITTKGHQAQDVFYRDVQDTFYRIKNRSAEINAQRAADGESGGDVEQIQLHAVEPGTEIKIQIPPEKSEDEGEKRGREIFEAFSPEFRKALETGNLDKVNEVLGKMKVPEAEEVVGLLGEAGILSLEERILDATTEEGRKQIKELEDQAAMESYTDDPE